jgi:predicted TIM-barrel fold metal-dependent hydrolase
MGGPFDCNVVLGKLKSPPPGGILDAPRLLSEMDRYQIEESLVYHAIAKRNSPARGNALAAKAAAVSPRLHACWMLLPPGTPELPPLDELWHEMERANVRAVRLAPDAGNHLYSLAPVVCGELFEWLAAHRLPLFLELNTITWNDVDAIFARYPELRLVLVDISYRIGRDLYPRLKAYPNLFIETSGVEQHCGVQEICELFGPERLLYGSRMPYFCAGASRHLIDKAGISEDAKQMILGDNLRSLLARSRGDTA